jgi:hypothetical protein
MSFFFFGPMWSNLFHHVQQTCGRHRLAEPYFMLCVIVANSYQHMQRSSTLSIQQLSTT